MSDHAIWGIHVRGVEGDRMYTTQNLIGIGWREIEDLRKLEANRDAFRREIEKHLPEKPRGYHINASGQLFRFAHEMKIGDWIVYRSKFDRQVYVGKVTGDYQYNPGISVEYPQIRPVVWSGKVPASTFSQGALYELGSALTLFQLKNYGEEFVSAVENHAIADEDAQDETVGPVAEGIKLSTEDFVLKQLARHLKGHAFEAFVANLLRTMGYRTIEAERRGPDEGIDIIAHRDELKLEPPIIKVQVKSTEGSVGRPDAQKLVGCLSEGEYGLLVTLGTLSPQAVEFAKGRSTIRLIDGPLLVALVLDHYEEIDPGYKSLIPLKRVYVPQPLTAE